MAKIDHEQKYLSHPHLCESRTIPPSRQLNPNPMPTGRINCGEEAIVVGVDGGGGCCPGVMGELSYGGNRRGVIDGVGVGGGVVQGGWKLSFLFLTDCTCTCFVFTNFRHLYKINFRIYLV